MKQYTIDVWYTAPNYARVNVEAIDEDSARAYARHLECHGQLSYDDAGDTCDSGIETVDIDDAPDFVALDKNNNVLTIGDQVEYESERYNPTTQQQEKVLLTQDITAIVKDGAEILVGVGDEEDFIEAINCVKVIQSPTLSDRDYWLQHGDCPKCRLGNTVQPQAGEFVCNKCGWKH